jgi:hypothetical protein
LGLSSESCCAPNAGFAVGFRTVCKIEAGFKSGSDGLESEHDIGVFFIMIVFEIEDTYDHRSVRTGHPVRNHNVSIVFVIPGTKILEKKVL